MARDDDEAADQPDEAEVGVDEGAEGRRGGIGVGFLIGFVVGGLVGAGTALLLAPARGSETRRRIGKRVRRFRRDAADRMGEMRDDAERELRRTRRRLQRHLSD